MVEAEQTEQEEKEEAAEEEEAAYLRASFRIDQEGLAGQGRSFQRILHHRRCASCWGTMVQRPDEGREIRASEHLRRIVKHCSAAADFIHSEMPLMEAVFRLLLTNNTKPMTVEEIYKGLEERWVDPVNPRIPLPKGVYWTLRSDTFYGIGQVASEES